MKKILVKLLLFLVFSKYLIAGEYALVSNKNMPLLTQEQVHAIFFKKMKNVNTLTIVPINLSPKNPLRVSFEKNILHTSFTQLKSYWMQQHYLGNRPPIRMKSQKSALAFLKKVNGAITYIDVKYIDKDMNIILRWND